MTAGRGAFAFETGEWRVHHRKLRGRLVGSADWVEFSGTTRAWELMEGEANVEDNFLDDPAGAYRAFAYRRTDPETGIWSIWWFDPRLAALELPVHGRFENGIGTFYADDQLNGRPIKVRYIWSGITAKAARWEQAFSPDAGKTWETNWIMTFERTA